MPSLTAYKCPTCLNMGRRHLKAAPCRGLDLQVQKKSKALSKHVLVPTHHTNNQVPVTLLQAAPSLLGLCERVASPHPPRNRLID